jgi:hypothetical protein
MDLVAEPGLASAGPFEFVPVVQLEPHSGVVAGKPGAQPWLEVDCTLDENNRMK